jgi:hypothetical protein
MTAKSQLQESSEEKRCINTEDVERLRQGRRENIQRS